MSAQQPPPWMSLDQLVQDDFQTRSSELATETVEDCLPLLEARIDAIPDLQREQHVEYLHRMLGRLPAGFASIDASRPWLLYWCTMGLVLLGEDVSTLREPLKASLKPIQDPQGGFGGGQGQIPHLATSYAAILALTNVSGDALDIVDRRAMWRWLGDLKKPEGDFAVAVDAERDVRGAYCAMTIITLLKLPLELPPDSPARQHGHETFTSGLGDYVSRCQTYEGGLGSAPATEAHGSYTFCALACLCLLGDPKETFHKYLDVPSLVSWLCLRQQAPLGGLAGRSNKLVDGCYSHWIGGCYALVEEAIRDEFRGPVWNRDALCRYILCCAQGAKGGLRDKPGMNVDAYHTCYNLAGLSSTQHAYVFDGPSQNGSSDPINTAKQWSGRNGFPPTPQATEMLHQVLMTSLDAAGVALHRFDSLA